MTFWSFIVLVISFMSFSCELNFASSNDENSSTSEISSINENLTYEKDEEGFFILDEKDYYQDNPQLNDLFFQIKLKIIRNQLRLDYILLVSKFRFIMSK